LAILVLLGATAAAAQAPIDLRVALVIGNSAYTRAPLQNPANDAEAMARSLKSLGFDVIELRDGSKAQMAEAIAKVRETLKGKQGVGMLYYSGHGLQLDWRNYMVPVDASLAKPADVPEQTVDVGSVIEAFKTAGNRMNILVLDACRDNPFAGTASGKGLAQLDAPPGTFLAYSTAPGNVADDGDGANGLYTQYLLAELGKPTAKIEDVFKRVRFQVRQKSAGRQIPWESTSLEDDFYFDDARSKAAKAERDRLAGDAAAREKVFAQEKSDWDRVKDSKVVADFYAFLNRYPNGAISLQAQEKVEWLARAQIQATPAKDREAETPLSDRYRVGDVLVIDYRDGLTNVVTKRETQRVTAIKDDRVEINGGAMVLTLSGGVVINEQGLRFDPPILAQPVTDLQPGRTWNARYDYFVNGQRNWSEQQFKIVAYEEVQVPAGTFKAYRIESDLNTQTGLRGKLTDWVVPSIGPVKHKRSMRLRNGSDASWGWELVSRQAVPRS
jgi:hypothetical protein